MTGNQDVCISMPAGSSRSLCYQLPGLMQETKITIVFCPSQLIKDNIKQLHKHKIRAESVNSNIAGYHAGRGKKYCIEETLRYKTND